MIDYSVKQIHNVSRPGHKPKAGDVVEVETVGGFVPAVDPVTRRATDEHKQFVITSDGNLRNA